MAVCPCVTRVIELFVTHEMRSNDGSFVPTWVGFCMCVWSIVCTQHDVIPMVEEGATRSACSFLQKRHVSRLNAGTAEPKSLDFGAKSGLVPNTVRHLVDHAASRVGLK